MNVAHYLVLSELVRRERLHQPLVNRDALRDAIGLDERVFGTTLEQLIDERKVSATPGRGNYVTVLPWGRDEIIGGRRR